MRWRWYWLFLAVMVSAPGGGRAQAGAEGAAAGEQESALAVPAPRSETPSIPVQPLGKAAAPETAKPEPVRLDPITTTSTRTARRSFEVPESVSQINAEQIEREGASSLSEALRYLVSVDVSGGPRPGADFISIRGIGGTRVALNVDGARQNYDGAHRSNLLLDPDLLKSVDILRGPASAIWGSDALGGVISMTTRDAADFLRDDEILGGRFKLGYEDASNERRSGLTLFGRLGGLDLLADTVLRATDDLRQADNQVLPYSAAKTRGGLYKLTQFFSAANELALSQQDYRQTTRSPSNPSKDAAEDNPLLDRTNGQSMTTARYTYQAQGVDPLFAGANLTLYRSLLDVVEDRVDEPRHDTLGFDTTGGSLQSTLNVLALESRLTLGAEAYRDRSQATRDGASRPQYPDARRDVRGAFVQNEFQWENLSLIPGLRYDRFRSHSNQSGTPDIDEAELSPKLGLNYELTDWLALNASYAGAFRAPSLLESFAQGTHFLGNEFRPNPDLRPEKARNRELGLRLRFANLSGSDDPLLLKFSVFDNEIRDYIETVVVVETTGPFPPALQCLPPSPAVGCVTRNEDGSANLAVPVLVHVGGYTTSENLPRARIRGGEAELQYEVGRYRFGLGYSRLRGENTATGAPLLSIPPDTLRMDHAYHWRGLHLGLRTTRAAGQDRVPLLEDGTPTIPHTAGYTVLDLYTQWHSAQWAPGLKLNLGLDNLTDQAYRHHLSNYAEAGRSLRAGMTYQF